MPTSPPAPTHGGRSSAEVPTARSAGCRDALHDLPVVPLRVSLQETPELAVALSLLRAVRVGLVGLLALEDDGEPVDAASFVRAVERRRDRATDRVDAVPVQVLHQVVLSAALEPKPSDRSVHLRTPLASWDDVLSTIVRRLPGMPPQAQVSTLALEVCGRSLSGLFGAFAGGRTTRCLAQRHPPAE